MASLLLTLLLTAAGATSGVNGAADCTSANDPRAAASYGVCVDRDTASTAAPIAGAARKGVDATSDAGDSTRNPDDEPWTYETGPDDLEHVCITRGAGGICLDSDD